MALSNKPKKKEKTARQKKLDVAKKAIRKIKADRQAKKSAQSEARKRPVPTDSAPPTVQKAKDFPIMKKRLAESLARSKRNVALKKKAAERRKTPTVVSMKEKLAEEARKKRKKKKNG